MRGPKVKPEQVEPLTTPQPPPTILKYGQVALAYAILQMEICCIYLSLASPAFQVI